MAPPKPAKTTSKAPSTPKQAKTTPAASPKPSKEAAAGATKEGKPGDVVQSCADAKITVVIDPGHGDKFKTTGGVDTGTVYPPDEKRKKGEEPEAVEKDIALEVSKAIKSKLTGKEHVKAVILTREADVTNLVVRFQWRKDVAKDNDARVFVSVHVNEAGSSSVTGHIMFYYAPNDDALIGAESQKLATAMDKSTTTIPARTSGGVIGQKSRMGLVQFGSPYPVKAAALVETGFIDNDGDRSNMKTKADALGGEIAEGIAAYIKENISLLCK